MFALTEDLGSKLFIQAMTATVVIEGKGFIEIA
jgi:hypothetical protein